MALELVQVLCGRDNYAVLIHDRPSGKTAIVDTPELAPIEAELKRRGWRLDLILTTHHHGDHTAGHAALKAQYGASVIAPASEFAKVPGADRGVKEGDVIDFAGHRISVIDTPGHTNGHVAFHFATENLLFAGDTLFALGCGRLLEGTPQAMWSSLRKLRALPASTIVYCGHEYTESNARFALTIEPDNQALKSRAAEIAEKRKKGEPTIPSRLADEIATNPFLRADQAGIAAHLGMGSASSDAVFAEIRSRKDRF